MTTLEYSEPGMPLKAMKSSRPGPGWRWALAAALTTAVVLATLMPASWIQFLRRTGAGESEIPSLLFGFIPFDKAVHFSLFGVTAAAWVSAFSARWRSLGLVLLIIVVLAAGTELLQALPMIGRDGGLDDGLADMLGGMSAIVVVGLLRISINKRSANLS